MVVYRYVLMKVMAVKRKGTRRTRRDDGSLGMVKGVVGENMFNGFEGFARKTLGQYSEV